MVTLRPTRKLHSALPPTASSLPSSTALGDWYVNRLVLQRQPLLLLVSSTSLLAIIVPARAVRELPIRLVDLVAHRLTRLSVRASLIEAESAQMHPVVIAPTVDRSVLGIMNDYTSMLRYYAEARNLDERALRAAEDRLADNPCFASTPNVVFPKDKAPELLTRKWASGNRP